MKWNFYCSLLLFFSILSCNSQAKNNQNSVSQDSNYYPKDLIEFIESIEMTILNNDEIINSKIAGGKGVPYLYGVSLSVNPLKNKTPANAIFWAKKNGKKKLIYVEDDLSDKNKVNYKVVDEISISRLLGFDYDDYGSYCLTSYNGVFGFNKDLSDFSNLDNQSIRGPKGIYPDLSNGFTPVIITQDSSTTVIYRYKDSWFIYVERDW
jgi:hypothetical protein